MEQNLGGKPAYIGFAVAQRQAIDDDEKPATRSGGRTVIVDGGALEPSTLDERYEREIAPAPLMARSTA